LTGMRHGHLCHLQVQGTEKTHGRATHERVGAAMQHVAEDVLPQLRALLRELTDALPPTRPTAVPPPLRRRVRHVRAALLHAAQLLDDEEEEEEEEDMEPPPPSMHSPVCSDGPWDGAEGTHRRSPEATEVDAALEPMIARYSQLYAERLGVKLMAVLAPHMLS
jgi:hypothetical protein